MPNTLIGDDKHHEWIKNNHPENGVFRVYWWVSDNFVDDTKTSFEDMGSGLRYEWYYKDGKRADGISKSWHSNGQLRQIDTYRDGKRNGLSTRWGDRGQKLLEGNYKEGRRGGVWTRWYKGLPDQKMIEWEYKSGKQDGKNWVYDSKKGMWAYDSILITKWNDDGQIDFEGIYSDGDPYHY